MAAADLLEQNSGPLNGRFHAASASGDSQSPDEQFFTSRKTAFKSFARRYLQGSPLRACPALRYVLIGFWLHCEVPFG